jgi:hypothetical protein
MSYTLKGRIESRLAGSLPALVVALALQRWWALELVALMLAIGVALDGCFYHRALVYQPGWLALPLGFGELVLTMGGVRALHVAAPVGGALGLFGLAWISSQLCGHALFPRLRLEYGQSGGELGRLGAVVATAVAAGAVAGVAGAYAVRPPTVHLHGVVQGPLVIRHAQTIVGGVVRGGVRVRADHVTLRRVTVVGGSNGIDVEHATHVVLDRVRVLQPELDGIHVLDSSVMIHDCSVFDPAGPWVQGIDISYSMGRSMSMISGCTVVGTREGITTHSSMVDVTNNRVLGTKVRGISLAEMSMDRASGNEVVSATGIGIVCMDYSMCEIRHNTVAGMRAANRYDATRHGVAIEAYYYAEAKVGQNTVIASPGGVRAFLSGTIAHD